MARVAMARVALLLSPCLSLFLFQALRLNESVHMEDLGALMSFIAHGAFTSSPLLHCVAAFAAVPLLDARLPIVALLIEMSNRELLSGSSGLYTSPQTGNHSGQGTPRVSPQVRGDQGMCISVHRVHILHAFVSGVICVRAICAGSRVAAPCMSPSQLPRDHGAPPHTSHATLARSADLRIRAAGPSS